MKCVVCLDHIIIIDILLLHNTNTGINPCHFPISPKSFVTGFQEHPLVSRTWMCLPVFNASNDNFIVLKRYIVIATGISFVFCHYGPLARYVKLGVAHAAGMPGTFSSPPRVGNPDMHHGTLVTHVPWCMPGSLTSGLKSVAGKTFPAFPAHARLAILHIW